MEIKNFKKMKLPDSPGVYFFIGEKEKILYIGRATSLQQRVRSYFSLKLEESRGALIKQMVERAKKIKFQKTDSVLESLILESILIKKHKPLYNTEEKDDKSFNYLVITKEKFPRVEVVRKTEIKNKFNQKEIDSLFGPFPKGVIFRDALKIIRKIFPFRDAKCFPAGDQKNKKGKPCFNRQINLCSGVCTGEISADDYQKIIKQLKFFLRGRKKQVFKMLEKEMKEKIKNWEFEEANEIKKKIFSLQHIQDVALIKNDELLLEENSKLNFKIEAYDISHTAGNFRVGVMVVFENGEPKKREYRKFKIIDDQKKGDGDALAEVLDRRLKHREWPFPQLLVVDGNEIQINVAKKTILKNNLIIPIVGVVKNEKHQPKKIIGLEKISPKLKKNILQANFEAHRFAISFHRKSFAKNFLK